MSRIFNKYSNTCTTETNPGKNSPTSIFHLRRRHCFPFPAALPAHKKTGPGKNGGAVWNPALQVSFIQLWLNAKKSPISKRIGTSSEWLCIGLHMSITPGLSFATNTCKKTSQSYKSFVRQSITFYAKKQKILPTNPILLAQTAVCA